MADPVQGRSHGWFLYSDHAPRGGRHVSLTEAPLDLFTQGKWMIMELANGRVVVEILSDVTENDSVRDFHFKIVDADAKVYQLDVIHSFAFNLTERVYARIFDPKAAPVNWTDEQYRVNIAHNIDLYLRKRPNATAKNSDIERWLIDYNLLPAHVCAPPGEKEPEAIKKKRKAYLRAIYRQWGHMFRSKGGVVNHTLRPTWEIDHIRTDLDAAVVVGRGLAMDSVGDKRIRINWWMLAQGLLLVIRAFNCFQLVDDARTPSIPEEDTFEDKVRRRARIRRDN